jgi:hypothetical protein
MVINERGGIESREAGTQRTGGANHNGVVPLEMRQVYPLPPMSTPSAQVQVTADPMRPHVRRWTTFAGKKF